MTYTNFAKWDSYSLLKKKYANIELLKKVPTKLNWLIIIAIYLIEIISIIITVTYTSTNPIDTGISYIDITIKQLFMNNNTFFSIILAISLIFATTVGISAKKYMRRNKRYDMIIALTNMKKEKIMNIMLLDFILVSQSETLLLIVFAVIAFVSVRFNCIIGILVGILCLITVIELSYIVIICSYMWQNYKIKLCLSIVSFITTLKIGNYIASWIARFPLMKKIATYSLGTKKKLQLICALISQPDVVLMDEYISGLDPKILYTVKNVMREYVKQGKIIILSTHMLDMAEKFCDDVILLNEGKIVKNTLPISEISRKYKDLEEYYLACVK